jgi:hypothetical protein
VHWAKKNATDCTEYTDPKRLADDTFELKRSGAEVEEQRQPESRGGQVMQRLRVLYREFVNKSVKSVASAAFLF